MVSIIIPVYNREAFLPECIDSILMQSYQNFEIILIDDGSTDRTPELCDKFAKEDSRIRVLSGGHKGVSAARNRGIDEARGDFLFFVDSDDVIHPLVLETLVRGMDDNGAAVGSVTKGRNTGTKYLSTWWRILAPVRFSSLIRI